MRHASDGCERILVSVTDAAAVIGRAIAEFIRAWAANVFVQYEIATAIGFPMTDPASFLTPFSTTGRRRDTESAGLARVGVSRFPVAANARRGPGGNGRMKRIFATGSS